MFAVSPTNPNLSCPFRLEGSAHVWPTSTLHYQIEICLLSLCYCRRGGGGWLRSVFYIFQKKRENLVLSYVWNCGMNSKRDSEGRGRFPPSWSGLANKHSCLFLTTFVPFISSSCRMHCHQPPHRTDDDWFPSGPSWEYRSKPHYNPANQTLICTHTPMQKKKSAHACPYMRSYTTHTHIKCWTEGCESATYPSIAVSHI